MPNSQLPPGLNRRYAFLASILLLAIWLWLALDRPYTLPSHLPWNIYSSTPESIPDDPLDIFEYPPLHSSAIKSICAATSWNVSLIFTCDDNVGGIGHVRNSILNCVRFSIAAGAGLILPKISIRNESDISNIHTGVLTNMAYMFDTRHFIDSISLSCPELKLFSSLDDFKDTNNWDNPVLLNPNVLGVKFPQIGMEDPMKFEAALPRAGFEKPELWAKFFWEWYADIAEQYNFVGIIKKGPMFVKLMRSYLTWPILSDGGAFSTQFGRILKLRADTRSLATKVLVNLVEEYKLDVDVKAPILENAFWGVHLRTEKDALDGLPVAGKNKLYPTYGMQSKLYLDHILRERNKVNTRLVYVASGDSDQLAKFWKDAKLANLTVITKAGLLKGNDLEELNNLEWDQQALVDLMVLAKASEFLGVGHSGFDWTIVGKRQASLLSKNGTQVEGVKENGEEKAMQMVTGGRDGDLALADGLSVLYGAKGELRAYKACLWP